MGILCSFYHKERIAYAKRKSNGASETSHHRCTPFRSEIDFPSLHRDGPATKCNKNKGRMGIYRGLRSFLCHQGETGYHIFQDRPGGKTLDIKSCDERLTGRIDELFTVLSETLPGSTEVTAESARQSHKVQRVLTSSQQSHKVQRVLTSSQQSHKEQKILTSSQQSHKEQSTDVITVKPQRMESTDVITAKSQRTESNDVISLDEDVERIFARHHNGMRIIT